MDRESARVGRDPTCDIVVSEATVSRRHARLFWEGQELVVEDLGSSGGTFLNGTRVERATVKPGDVIRFGPRVEYTVESETPTASLGMVAEREGGEEGLRHLQVLLEVARALNAATVLEEVLEIVLQASVRLSKADRGCVILVGEKSKRSAVALYPRGQSEKEWAEQSSLVERAIRERRAVIAGGQIDVSTSMVRRGVGMAVAAPLLVARRPVGPSQDASFIATVEAIGGILVERAAAGAGFSRDELAIFESLAADAAVAIDSAHLYREAREKAKIEHEMSLARTIQMALLKPPPEVPFAEVFAYSQPARVVGGDLYQGTMRPDGGLALAVGDVSGKGVSASLIMAMAQGLLGLLHNLGKDLDEVLPALNQSLREHNPGNRFLTLGACIVYPDGRVQLANAGHCPLALVRASGEIELIRPHGPVLGLLPVGAWRSQEVQLAPGDGLVLYSDGIAESFSLRGEEFGTEGVARTAAALLGKSPEEIGQGILDAASAHRSGREADDDVTVLVMRYRG